ncbi:hypothetical protein MPSEU_000335200 [Mayamaea pseudoterrestris]|nr:hypothetical protein MPSEU_000335200 [Mayamaea pseudoterrestris]
MSASPSWRRAQEVAWSQAQRSVLEDLEKQYLQLKQERSNAYDALQTEKAIVSKLQVELTASRQVVVNETQLQHELTVAKQTIVEKEENQKLVQERMDRMQTEADQLREELSRLKKSNESLQKELSTQQVAGQIQESQAIPLLHEKHRLQTELDAVHAHASWLEQELADKQKQISKLRQDNGDHLLQVQLQLDVIANEKEAAVAKYNEVSKMELRLQEKVTELSRDLLELKHEKTQLEHDHEVELADERKLTDMQKRQIEQWKQRCQSLEKQNEALQQAAEQAVTLADQEKLDLRKELEEKFQVLLHEQATELQKQAIVPRVSGAARGLMLMDADRRSDDGDAMDDDDDEPLGLTEMYTRYHETKRALRRERKEKEHCQSILFDLEREIQASAPGLVRQREEYDRAMDSIKEFQKRLHDALEERDFVRNENQASRQEATNLAKEVRALKQENHLLAQQIQALLRKEAGAAVDMNFPVDIAQMQSQNQKLISDRLRLQAKINELEGRLQTDVLRTKLDTSEAELKALKDERTKQMELMDKLVQQRDLYRALLHQSGNHSGVALDDQSALQQISLQSERSTRLELTNRELEKDLSETRGQLGALKRENDDVSERLRRQEAHATELMSSVSQHERDLLSARSQVARAESDAHYHKEKCERLEESLERARKEMAQVNNAYNQLQRINADLHQAVSNANNQCSSQESESKQAQMKLRLLETELQTARSAESRLAEENNRLHADMARQGSMMDNIRRIETKLASKSEGEMAGALAEADRLRGQLDREQTKSASLVEDLNGRISILDIRLHESETVKSKLLEEVAGVKEQLLVAQTGLKEGQTKISELEIQLRLAKRKLGEIADDDETQVELSLRNRIKTLADDLETTKMEKKSLAKEAEHYKKIAADSDEALTDLSAAIKSSEEKLDQEKRDFQQRIEGLQQDNAAKQQLVVEMTSDLVRQRGEREQAENALRSEIAALHGEIQANKHDTDAAKALAVAMKVDMEVLREERDNALNNYERELTVHSESRTALRQAREQADKESQLRRAFEEKFETLKVEMDQRLELWNNEKRLLEESMTMAEKNLASAREQNSLLHRQLESLGSAMEKKMGESQIDSTAELPSNFDELRKSLAETREVIKILRSENELLQTELDNVKRTVERERAGASMIRRSLDEARAELSELRKQSGLSDTTAEVDALKEKVAALESQASLLNDSNYVLRESAEKLQQTLSITQKELDETKIALQPKELAKREQETKIAVLTAENESLRRDLDDWKNRVQSIVSKFNQVDPVEHSQLKKRVDELAKENESLTAWKRTTEEENTRIRTIATKLKEKNIKLQKEMQEKEAQLESASNSTAMSAVSNERDELKLRSTELEKEVASRKLEVAGLTTQTENLRTRLRQLMAEKQEANSTETTLKASIVRLEARLEAHVAAEKLRQAAPVLTVPPHAPAKGVMDTIPESQLVSEKQTNIVTEHRQASVPSVPLEGFKFGPSDRPKPDEITKQNSDNLNAETERVSLTPSTTEAPVASHLSTASTTTTTTLRPSAPLFQPRATSNSQQEQPAPPNPRVEDPPTPPSIRKEVSIKEKLMEKKRKLQEALSRKAASDAIATPEAKHEENNALPKSSETPGSKRHKTSIDEAEGPEIKQGEIAPEVPEAKETKVGETSPKEPEADESKLELEDSQPVVHSPETETKLEEKESASKAPSASEAEIVIVDDEEETKDVETTDDVVYAPPEGVNEMIPEAEEGEEADKNDDGTIEIEPEASKPADATLNISNPFAATPSTTPFFGGGFGGGFGAAFGSSSAGPTFGQAATSAPITGFGALASSAPSTGGAFLDIKPPGSSSTAPLFSFGNSSSITLPIPTQPPPASSPFGAFNTTSSTGTGGFSFGQSSTTFGARPLFGAPAAPVADVMEDETEEDKMEGEMEADE